MVNGPLAGATVEIYTAAGTLLGQTFTDASGYYQIAGLSAPGPYRVVATNGTLDGRPYPGTLSSRCSELPCELTPLTTAIDTLAQD